MYKCIYTYIYIYVCIHMYIQPCTKYVAHTEVDAGYLGAPPSRFISYKLIRKL